MRARKSFYLDRVARLMRLRAHHPEVTGIDGVEDSEAISNI